MPSTAAVSSKAFIRSVAGPVRVIFVVALSLGLAGWPRMSAANETHAQAVPMTAPAETGSENADAAGAAKDMRAGGTQAEESTQKVAAAEETKDSSEVAAEGTARRGEEVLYPAELRDHWPPVEQLVTSAYGEKRSGLTSYETARTHLGLDIRAHLGWPVRSLRNGVVRQAGNGGRSGLMVQVAQDDGKTVAYAHLSEILVRKGDKVARGQYVGKVGCTGRTSGSHLHIAVRDAEGRPCNPRHEFTGLWELFDPPLKDLAGPIEPMACPMRERLKASPNKRLIGTQQYLRMRKALQQNKFKVPDYR